MNSNSILRNVLSQCCLELCDFSVNYILHCSMYPIALAWPVPSTGEKGGGLGVGLATPPCNTVNATETNIREQDANGARNEEPSDFGDDDR